MPAKYKIYECTNTHCKSSNKEVTVLGTAIKPKCKGCHTPLTFVRDVEIASNKQEAPSYVLNHGDTEQICLEVGAAKDMIVQGQSGDFWLRLLQDPKSGEKKVLLLLAHGRQAGPPAGTVDKDFPMRSFAYMVPMGYQLVRDYYQNSLDEYVSRFKEQPLAWVTSGIPDAYVGPHTKGECDVLKKAFASTIKHCDIAIFTKLVLKEQARAPFKADGKVPLYEVIANYQFGNYQQYLLMVCRSPWKEENFISKNCGGAGIQGRPGYLHSYDDAFRSCVDDVEEPNDTVMFPKDWPFKREGAFGYKPEAVQGLNKAT